MATIMSSTPVRYPTPNASTGSPQPTSVEVTDPLLWQGLRQVKAKGRPPTLWHRGFSLFLFIFSAVKASCPYNMQLQMGVTWTWPCDGIVGLTTSSALDNAGDWRSWSPTWPRTMVPRLCSGTGVLALRCRTSRSPCRVEFNTRYFNVNRFYPKTPLS